jgi:aminoethylphosphonate catabolism LysR family transcriptional regulator
MRLTQLRSFHAVAVEKGFTRAAKLLHVSQPTITSQVRLLEETYNVQLFHRRGSGVSLTALGEQLLKISQQMFWLETDAVHLLRDSGQLKNGDLRIASVGPRHISKVIVEFKKRHPGIRISATTGNSQEVVDRLLDYRADIGVLAHSLHDDRFLAVPLGKYPIVIFTSAGHPFAARKSIRLADLQGQRLIRRESGSTTRKELERALAKADVKPDVVMESSSRELIRECVLHELGIAAVSRIEFVPDPGLHMVTISDADLYIEAHVLCLRERHDTRLVQEFLNTVPQAEKRPARPPASGVPARKGPRG